MLAYTYPILSFIWMMFVFFVFVSVDFRRPDLSGWAKAGWALVILLLPLLGTLIYLVARPAVVEVAV
jgi:hypothetical protein